MTNNKLCDIIGTIGCLVSFLALVAGILGAASWWIVLIGIIMILGSQFEYED